jgi:hypothetical protein
MLTGPQREQMSSDTFHHPNPVVHNFEICAFTKLETHNRKLMADSKDYKKRKLIVFALNVSGLPRCGAPFELLRLLLEAGGSETMKTVCYKKWKNQNSGSNRYSPGPIPTNSKWNQWPLSIQQQLCKSGNASAQIEEADGA